MPIYDAFQSQRLDKRMDVLGTKESEMHQWWIQQEGGGQRGPASPLPIHKQMDAKGGRIDFMFLALLPLTPSLDPLQHKDWKRKNVTNYTYTRIKEVLFPWA